MGAGTRGLKRGKGGSAERLGGYRYIASLWVHGWECCSLRVVREGYLEKERYLDWIERGIVTTIMVVA